MPVAQALAAADGFGVARIGEGLALRAAGLENRILLMEGVLEPGQLDAAAENVFDLVVHEAEQLAWLEAWRGRHRFRVWLKVDSGMGRLGFRPDDVPAVLPRLRSCAAVEEPMHLMTHLADAENPGGMQTRSQLEAFNRAVTGLAGERSIANSAGLLNWPDARQDWVRPGVMLYGISPLPDQSATDLGLRPVMTLETRVIAVKDLAAGDRVGYGGTWQAPGPSRIAVAAAGYGDGYPRSAAPGTRVLVRGQVARLAGRVSMDMLTLDVTGLDGISVGDPVQLWGTDIPVAQVAEAAGTITYELLCRVSERVQRQIV